MRLTASTAVFMATVMVVAVCWIRAMLAARGLAPQTRIQVAALGLIVGLVVPGLLAAGGFLDRYHPLPAPVFILVAIVAVVNVVLMVSRVGAALVSSVSLTWLVGFQAFRIPVEWWLHRGFIEGFVPVQMTYAGRNFDVVSGLTALGLALWLAVGRPHKAIVMAWNILGLALLANIVAVAVLSTPVPFRGFPDGPPNLLPSTLPFVWLPTFLVQAALAGHLLVFRALARPRT